MQIDPKKDIPEKQSFGLWKNGQYKFKFLKSTMKDESFDTHHDPFH
jgi:hypothetical protein